MDDAEEIRRKKLLELQAKLEEQRRQQELRKQYEVQKRQALQRILSPEARSRLSNLRVAKPEYVENLELQLIQLVRTGRINPPITDKQLREVLRKIQQHKPSFRIRRK
ncbi:MAG: DNA-binding protein [Candidatus Hadarchaeota archaeon]|nr:DNA-binding protein [Candidatus Hadarchaeota archaeon]